MDMTNQTLITLAWELNEQRVPKTHIAAKLARHRETISLWIRGIERYGLLSYLERYGEAKKGPRRRRQIDSRLKDLIWMIREREMDCCGEKIRYFLEKEYRIKVSSSKIYEILAERYQLRSRWKKNQVRGPVPHAAKPREVVQMDSIDFGELFAFTGIDVYTREADILIAPQLTAHHGYRFLRQSMERRFDGHVQLLQNDGGPEFKDEFRRHVGEFCDRHRVSRPYKKNEQSFIESFNRTVRKECLGWKKYRKHELSFCEQLVGRFLERYHYHRPHMGIGMRPPLSA